MTFELDESYCKLLAKATTVLNKRLNRSFTQEEVLQRAILSFVLATHVSPQEHLEGGINLELEEVIHILDHPNFRIVAKALNDGVEAYTEAAGEAILDALDKVPDIQSKSRQ